MDGNTAKVDDALDVLKSTERRQILEYLDGESDESATVADLASHLASAESRDEQTLEARLHHVHLPRLADHGILEYDARSGAVRFRSDAHVETLLGCLHNDC